VNSGPEGNSPSSEEQERWIFFAAVKEKRRTKKAQRESFSSLGRGASESAVKEEGNDES